MDIKKIAARCQSMDFHSLSQEVIETAKKCLLDFLGAAFAGRQTQAADIAMRSSKWFGTDNQCTIIGFPILMSPVSAAFVNGTLGSALDVDDGHRGAVGHPGAMVFPAALSVGEVRQVTGKEFLTAVVIGYELSIRCGVVMNSIHEKRFYGSGGWAVFGSAAAAARLLGLKEKSLLNALTIGEVYGPTAQCGKSIAYGAMTKESIGWGAATGVFAAFLAQEGFTGPEEILLDEQDYLPKIKEILCNFGEKFENLNIYFKQFTSCRWSHSPISAALQIREKYHPNLQNVKEIRIETFKKALTLNHSFPKSSEAAQYSIPFTVANALVFGKVGPKQVAEENLKNLDVRKIIGKIKMVHAIDLEPLFPAARPARVIMEMADGLSFREEVHLVKGDPENPLDWDDLIFKFNEFTGPYLDKDKRMEIIKIVRSLDDLKDIRILSGLLRVGSPIFSV